MRPSPTRPAPPRRARALWRGAVVACALVGYLAAWGGTSAGQGWRLAPHLATAHAEAPPALVQQAEGRRVLTTLRPEAHGEQAPHSHPGAHSHGGHAADHAHPPDRSHAAPLAAHAARRHPPAASPTAHRHGDVVHDHAPAPPEPERPVVSVDKHRLPAGAQVPPPPAGAAPHDGYGGGPSVAGPPVETPPPIRRG